MAILLIVFLLFLALAALCPGPPEPFVKLEGCRCAHCQWYLNRREECSDQAPHRLGYIFPRWAFSSPQEMIDAWGHGASEEVIRRSLAYVEAEVRREIIDNITNTKPMGPDPGPIHYYKPAA